MKKRVFYSLLENIVPYGLQMWPQVQQVKNKIRTVESVYTRRRLQHRHRDRVKNKKFAKNEGKSLYYKNSRKQSTVNVCSHGENSRGYIWPKTNFEVSSKKKKRSTSRRLAKLNKKKSCIKKVMAARVWMREIEVIGIYKV